MSFVKRLAGALDEMLTTLEKISAANQEKKEKATLAHLRGESHDEAICALCEAETEVADCSKHKFGECLASCRYRSGILLDCTLHKYDSCSPDCRWRK